MIFSRTQIEVPFSVPTDSADLHMAAGSLVGLLYLEWFDDLARGIHREHGWFKITYSFADAAGTMWRYSAVLTPYAALPPEGVLGSLAIGSFKPSVRLKCLLDSRDLIEILLVDGRRIRTLAKYNDATFLLREDPDGVAVRLTVLGDRGGEVGRDNEYITVDYHLPLARLLWRKAPRLSHDDVMPEAADHVSCVRFGHINDSGRTKGFVPGPVHATPRQP